jgi:hypothetical protein
MIRNIESSDAEESTRREAKDDRRSEETSNVMMMRRYKRIERVVMQRDERIDV